LSENSDISVDDAEAALLHQPENMAKETRARRSLERRIRVREMGSNVALPHRAEQGIHQGVKKHIGIGMARKADVAGNMKPTKNQFPARHQAMNIETLADPVPPIQNPISFCNQRAR